MSVFETMIDQINAIYGPTVRGYQTEGSDPAIRNFNRKHAASHVLGNSFLEATRSLGVNKLAMPVMFSSDANYHLINQAVGHGYVGNNHNPNPAGLGLVTSQRGLALATPWSDAPAWIVVYVDPAASNVRVLSSGAGIWNRLPHGTVRQTVALIESEVDHLGGQFSIQNLWVATSPGARNFGTAPFRLDDRGMQMLSTGATAPYMEEFLRIDEEQAESEPPYVLDLSGLVRQLWLDQAIDPAKLFFDKRPNASVSSASKRVAEAQGRTSVSSELMAAALI